MNFCCDEMRAQVERVCDVHPDRWACPDCLIVRSSRGTFGLMIHDCGTASIRIHFCPWCGASLPDSRPAPDDTAGADPEGLH
jgi:hypothetical protein